MLNHGIIQRGLTDYIPKKPVPIPIREGSHEKKSVEEKVLTPITDVG
jgi:hypothetical protein